MMLGCLLAKPGGCALSDCKADPSGRGLLCIQKTRALFEQTIASSGVLFILLEFKLIGPYPAHY